MIQLSITSTLRLALAKAESENRQLKREVALYHEQMAIWRDRIATSAKEIQKINDHRKANR